MPEILLHALELQLHLLPQLQVECAERLVEQQHLRLVDERAGQRHALALAAGELARLAAADIGQPHQAQGLLDARRPLRPRDPFTRSP